MGAWLPYRRARRFLSEFFPFGAGVWRSPRGGDTVVASLATLQIFATLILVVVCANTANLLLAYDAQSAAADLSPDLRDNTAIVPKAIVIDDAFDWQGVCPPDRGLEQLTDGRLRIADGRLVEQDRLLVEAAELALDDLLEHVGRLARVRLHR